MKAILGAALLSLAATSGFAQGLGDASFGLGVSTLGVTGEVGYRIDPNLNVRAIAGAASLSRTRDVNESNTSGTFSGKVNIGGLGAVLDYHPFQNGVRVSGGALISNYRVSGSLSGNVVINNNSYNNAVLDASVKAKNAIMPKLSVGFVGTQIMGTPLGLSADVGVLYSGGFKSSITQRSGTPIPASDLDIARRDLADAVSKAKVLPFVSLGLNFKF